ncbi:conserved hypothetical protein [Alkaliphilus metalliredigens QYMF]|uniref:Uracil-DNA glycosylase-like domain-containing protein n=1 Tax=Alkaliphilus metalliredigens (strain QYMF) TaxID=293826 RepID=A6TMT4_ALKMQ|nr:DNA-deoxyinosine glycosylase [Alkaliphilus metalliredigens]ABR47502.1 conserved hypothetical protein [Alkaliphilus metalliredigens QYMF]
MSKIESFSPIIDANSHILILGSIPSVQSLQEGKYYGNPRNQFWKIIYEVLGQPFQEDYGKKVQFIKEHGIAIWDVIESCHREGSLDSNIKEERPNDFNTFLKSYPRIKYVLFNGTKAHDTFRRKVGFSFEDKIFHKLPSSSPAHTMKIGNKIEEWKVLLKYTQG